MTDMLERASTIADEVLFPAAANVDASGVVPESHFRLLADEGFYGLAAPAEQGGPDLDLDSLTGILDTLAGGCLTTAFTWMQHHGFVAGLAGSPRAELREQYLADAVKGKLRGGIAFAGVLAQPPKLRATPTAEGYVLDGEVPLVSGWGIVDLILIFARDGDTVVGGLIEPRPGDALAADRLQLFAAQGTATVRLTFDGYPLSAERVLDAVSHEEFVAGQTFGSRLNGCAATGVAGRCIRLLAEDGKEELAEELHDQRLDVRRRLDAALDEPESLPGARAAAGELAYRAAGALAVATGSSAIVGSHHAQRLLREATFTLVTASNPDIKNHLLGLLR